MTKSRNIRLLVTLAPILLSGCFVRDLRLETHRPPTGRAGQRRVVEATGYCPCGECCGWRRNWFGRPVIAQGPARGRPKRVGYTASGTRAQPGTIAADTALFPFGTVIYVPGYGYGRVEDRGSDIRGLRLDLYFRSHARALEWGRKRLEALVWPPDSPRVR
jgi:3D (Asp-Asp-Asp) domain-containing protein